MIELSEIVLYENCAIMPEKNFKVDDLEDYLATLTSFPYSSAQIIKHNLDLTIKITKQENNLEIKQFPLLEAEITLPNYNYCKIRNKERISNAVQPPFQYFYYFIVDKRWISSEAIELTLRMDTLNSLKSYVSLSEKTTILRQHKNRWKNASSPELYLPVVDLYSEGIEPVLFKKQEVDLYQQEDDEFVEGNWYLIYRSHTDDENSPIDILLCGDSDIPVDVSAVSGYTGNFNLSIDRDAGYDPSYVIYGGDANIGCKMTFKYWTSRKEYDYASFTITASNQCIFLTRRRIYFGTVDASGYTITHWYEYTSLANKSFEEVEFEGIKCLRQDIPNSVLIPARPTNLTTTIISSMHENSKIKNYVGAQGTIEPIDAVNRTDPKLLKIIKLPYRPLNFSFNASGVLTSLPAGWTYEGTLVDFPHMLRYTEENTTKALSHNFFLFGDDEYESPYEILEYESQSNRGKRISKSDHYETKLLHSDYLVQKFVYDSFAFNFRAELMDTDGAPQTLYTTFSVSLTMSSKFMFQFPLTTFGSGLKLDTQDYSGMAYVVRNNELPIFNSAYLNYIRTGYNYDIKTRNRQLSSNIVLGSLSLIGAVASAVGGGPLGTAGAIGLGVNALSKFTSTAFSTAQADQNIAQKLKTAEMQGLSVAGSDDVDLMSIYTNDNKAKLIKYEVSDRMKKAMFDLFYYCGYIAGYQGVPNETTRKVFNFVQAEIVFNTLNYNIPAKLLEDYRSKYHDGITIIHHYTLKNNDNVDVRGWDFEQQYENWETSTAS